VLGKEKKDILARRWLADGHLNWACDSLGVPGPDETETANTSKPSTSKELLESDQGTLAFLEFKISFDISGCGVAT